MIRADRFPPFLIALLLASAGLACDGGTNGRGAVVRSDSANVQLVHNESASDSITARLEETARIGLVDGAEEYQFDGIVGIVVDDADTLYVAHGRTSSIRVFDPNGKFVREFGREGQGPGELDAIDRLWIGGDTVVVADGGRTSVFRRSGEYIERWNNLVDDSTFTSVLARVPEGWLALVAREPPRKAAKPGVPFELNADLLVLDPRTRRPGPLLRSQRMARLVPGPGGELDWALFDPKPGMEVARDGTQYVGGEDYRIDVFDRAGRHVRRITRSHTPRPIAPGAVDALKERIQQRYRERPSPSASEAANLLRRIDAKEAGRIATQWGPIRRIVADPTGALWVERSDLGADPWMVEYEDLFRSRSVPAGRRDSQWDRFDRDGRFLGAIQVPEGFTPHALAEESVIGVLRDDLDVEYVVRYAIVGINEPPADKE